MNHGISDHEAVKGTGRTRRGHNVFKEAEVMALEELSTTMNKLTFSFFGSESEKRVSSRKYEYQRSVQCDAHFDGFIVLVLDWCH